MQSDQQRQDIKVMPGCGTKFDVDFKEAYTAHEWQEYRLSAIFSVMN